jgi:hypothetical protein
MKKWRLLRENGVVQAHWIFVFAAAVALAVGGLAYWLRSGSCVDTVPGWDGRCWGERDLVVEQGAVLCRCRRSR